MEQDNRAISFISGRIRQLEDTLALLQTSSASATSPSSQNMAPIGSESLRPRGPTCSSSPPHRRHPPAERPAGGLNHAPQGDMRAAGTIIRDAGARIAATQVKGRHWGRADKEGDHLRGARHQAAQAEITARLPLEARAGATPTRWPPFSGWPTNIIANQRDGPQGGLKAAGAAFPGGQPGQPGVLSLQPAGASTGQASSVAHPASQDLRGTPPAPARAWAGRAGPQPCTGARCPCQPSPVHGAGLQVALRPRTWPPCQPAPVHGTGLQLAPCPYIYFWQPRQPPPQHNRPGGSTRSTGRDPAPAHPDSQRAPTTRHQLGASRGGAWEGWPGTSESQPTPRICGIDADTFPLKFLVPNYHSRRVQGSLQVVFP